MSTAQEYWLAATVGIFALWCVELSQFFRKKCVTTADSSAACTETARRTVTATASLLLLRLHLQTVQIVPSKLDKQLVTRSAVLEALVLLQLELEL